MSRRGPLAQAPVSPLPVSWTPGGCAALGVGAPGARASVRSGRARVRSPMLCVDSAPALDLEASRCQARCTAPLRHAPVTPFQGKNLPFM